jgi:hypothetical protein
MERKFKIPNAAVAGRIKELAVSVEGGQTYLVVKFLEPPDSASVCELEHAAHSAAHRIEVLAGGGGRTDRAGKRNVDRSPELDGLIGESELIGSVAKNILATFHSSDELVDAITSCMVSEFLQQIPPE